MQADLFFVSYQFGDLPVNWPNLLGPFQNILTTFFNVYVFRMSLYMTSSKKKSDINFLIVF